MWLLDRGKQYWEPGSNITSTSIMRDYNMKEHILVCCVHHDREHILVLCSSGPWTYSGVVFIRTVNIFWCAVHHDREHFLVCCGHLDREHILWCVVFIMTVNIFLCVVHHDREHILVCCVHYDREHVLVCCVHHDLDIFWCVVFIMSMNIFWCVVFIMTVNIFWYLVFIMTVNIFWCVVFIMTVNWGIEIKSLFLNVSFRFILHTFGFFSLLLPHSLHIVRECSYYPESHDGCHTWSMCCLTFRGNWDMFMFMCVFYFFFWQRVCLSWLIYLICFYP